MELRLPGVVGLPDAGVVLPYSGVCKPEDLGVVYLISDFTVVPIISMSGK